MMVEPSGITVSCLPPPGAKGMSICPVIIRGRIASDCRLWRKSISAGVIHTSHIKTMAPLTVTWITEIVCKEQGTRDTSVTSHWLRGLRIFPEQSAGLASGWTFSSIYTGRSGYPLTISTGSDVAMNSLFVALGNYPIPQRPNQVLVDTAA